MRSGTGSRHACARRWDAVQSAPCKIASIHDGQAGGLAAASQGRAGMLRRRVKVSRRIAKGRKGVLRRSTDVGLKKALFGQSTGLKFAVIEELITV